MSAIVSVDVIPEVSTGVLPPLAGGIVIVSLILAGSGATDDQEDHAGVAAGGMALGALEMDLASAGALCARCVDLAGPYVRGSPLEAEEVGDIHRSHSPCHTEARWGPALWPAQGSVLCRGSC